jgi:hypothetical protein
MEFNGQLHAPAPSLARKELTGPIVYEGRWVSELVCTVWKREKFFLPRS